MLRVVLFGGRDFAVRLVSVFGGIFLIFRQFALEATQPKNGLENIVMREYVYIRTAVDGVS